MNKRLLAIAIGLATLDIATQAHAATDPNAKSEQVLVSARRIEENLPQDIAQYGARVDVITSESIKRGSYVDIAGSLQALAPSLYIASKNGAFDYVDVSLLGSRTQDVLWLIDGVRINNRLYAGTTPLDTIPSGIVDRIEILNGGQALFYGTQAVAGAINVVTKEFSNSLDGGVTLSDDNHQGHHADAFYRDAFERNQIVAYASIDKSAGYRAFRDEDYQPSVTDRNRSFDVRTVGAKYAFNATDALRLSATYQNTDADLDNAQPYRIDKNENSRREQIATAKVDYDATDNVGLFLKTYWHKWDTHYDTVYNNLPLGSGQAVLYDNAFWGYKDYGANAVAKFRFSDKVEYYAGYDIQKYGGRDEVLVIEQQDERTQAVFGQVRTNDLFLQDTELAAGVRYNDPSVGESATIWNVSGLHHFGGRFFARTTFGTNFRLPTAEELFADDPQDERGNPNLKPERSSSINFSIGQNASALGQLGWELTGFDRRIKDMIDYDEFDDSTGQEVFGNLPGTVKQRGVDAQIQWPLLDTVILKAGYTYSKSEDADSHEQIRRVPVRLAKTSLAYTAPGGRFGGDVAAQYTGDVFETVSGERRNYGNYSTFDFDAFWFADGQLHHRLGLSLLNAFDKEYGRPTRACGDVATDGAYDCSAPYVAKNLGLPRTLRASYSYSF